MKTLVNSIFIMVFAGCGSSFSETIPPSEPESGLLCTLTSARITESSGIDISTRSNDLYWTHNDSGDTPTFFAFNKNGNDLGSYTLKGVTAIDWEDMASAKLADISYLYAADVGDNQLKRTQVEIYRIVEPAPRIGDHSVAQFDRYILKYPDGPHNCESFVVMPSGEFQLITKDPTGISGIYSCKKPLAGRENLLVRIGEIKLDTSDNKLLTAADVSASGAQLVMRTYTTAYLFQRNDSGIWHKSIPKQFPLPVELQGEAICFDFGDKRVVTTSEGSPCRVSYAAVPN